MSRRSTDDPQEADISSADIENLPPSAKLVLNSLHNTNGRTTKELANDTCIAERTIRYALARLDKMDVIESQYLLSNPQTRQYQLVPDDERFGSVLES